MVSRKLVPFICLSLLSSAIAHPLRAQKTLWYELIAQVVKLNQQGKYSEAIPLGQESVRVAEATFGPEHPNVATSLNKLAGVYMNQGRYADAEPLFKRALAIREKALGANQPAVAQSLADLATAYVRQGRYAEAEPLYTRALAIYGKKFGPEHLHVATTLKLLAALYLLVANS